MALCCACVLGCREAGPGGKVGALDGDMVAEATFGKEIFANIFHLPPSSKLSSLSIM